MTRYTESELVAFRKEIGVPDAHPYDCDCDRCRRMWATVSAENPDGSPFFTDEELERLANEP